MILVGLTGGIGSGKSSVSARLAELGAVVIDADVLVREMQAPGMPMVHRLAERFGLGVVDADGALNRPALAALAFGDASALSDLNAIVHPMVAREMSDQIDAEFGSDHVVVLDIPLLAENPRRGLAATVVVDCPVDVAVHRLMAFRGFTEQDALARVARQSTREQRRAIATYVLDNSGSPAALRQQVDTLWIALNKLPSTTLADLELYRARPASLPADPAKP